MVAAVVQLWKIPMAGRDDVIVVVHPRRPSAARRLSETPSSHSSTTPSISTYTSTLESRGRGHAGMVEHGVGAPGREQERRGQDVEDGAWYMVLVVVIILGTFGDFLLGNDECILQSPDYAGTPERSPLQTSNGPSFHRPSSACPRPSRKPTVAVPPPPSPPPSSLHRSHPGMQPKYHATHTKTPKRTSIPTVTHAPIHTLQARAPEASGGPVRQHQNHWRLSEFNFLRNNLLEISSIGGRSVHSHEGG
ncbi:hypothetical protein DFP72DRAFT_1052003 [Ephemerocybe angulata]|uniref:Uncharacterized protein n=1 Tax=Ephemerocybe angulata TaxID=980116 RepID=A0A8H6HCF0_9AGAR|nr:hypothetical protein DFP72DRAFT_1052003 [Tulosesus angulatus]